MGILRLDGTVTDVLDDIGKNPWKREGPNMAGAGIYRLVHDPAKPPPVDPAGDTTLVAAASTGLYSRSGGLVENADWNRKSGAAPFDFDSDSGVSCTDAIWQPASPAPARPARLWVAIMDPSGARTNIHVSENGIAGPFEEIALPDRHPSGRLGLALAVNGVVYALGRLADNKAQIWRINPDKSVQKVANTPIGIFDAPETDTAGNVTVEAGQADYDLAIATDPTNADRVFVGGAAILHGGHWNASIYRLIISEPTTGNYKTDFTPANQSTPAADPTFFGAGIHPDVHALSMTSNGLWVGCDGGVFRRAIGNPAIALNSGLAVAEPGYLASHPADDGPCVAGTQDNGRIRRIGDTLWELWGKGDGGGVAYHPHDPTAYVGQYIRAKWVVNKGQFLPPVFRPALPATATDDQKDNKKNSEKSENSSASFYSAAAVISGARRKADDTPEPGTEGNARIAIGTHRIWLSENWDPNAASTNAWVTLPTGTDARGSPRNDTQDVLISDNIKALKWASPGDPKDGFKGAKLLILTRKALLQFTKGDTTAWGRKSFNASPAEDDGETGGKTKKKNEIRTNEAIPDGPSAKLPRVGIWTDIAPHESGRGAHGSFYIATTGKAEVLPDGSLKEADKMDTLWWFDGTDKFYPTGLRNTPLDAGAGTSGSKAPAYAVLVDPDHSEIVYVGNALGVWKGTLSIAGDGKPSWEWRGMLNGLPQAVVQDLSFFKDAEKRLLRAALQSRGIWEVDLSASPKSVGKTYLRFHNLDTRRGQISETPVDPLSGSALDPAQSPDVLALLAGDPPPWGSGMPTEAAMFAATEEIRAASSPQRHSPGAFRVFVLIHHRHTRRLAGGEARALLLQLNGAPADLTTVSLGGAWAQAVMALFSGSGAAPAGWHIADSTTAIRSPALELDARTPRAVAFDADLSHGFAGSAKEDSVLLLAIVTSTSDALTQASLNKPNLDALLRRNGHVAARRVLRQAPPPSP